MMEDDKNLEDFIRELEYAAQLENDEWYSENLFDEDCEQIDLRLLLEEDDYELPENDSQH